MKNRILLALSLIIAVVALVMSLTVRAEAAVDQTTCPVMGGKINKALYADVEGKRIYVCCEGCIATIKDDPAKYIKKLEDAGITIASATDAMEPMMAIHNSSQNHDNVVLKQAKGPQAICPVSAKNINKELFVDAGGKRVYVCCGNCQAKVKADPAMYIKKLEDIGVTIERVSK